MPPKVHVTSDDPEFDTIILSHLRQEGFEVHYFPYNGNVKEYKNALAHLPDDLELGESFAIIGESDQIQIAFERGSTDCIGIAYGGAAAICLDVCIKPMPHLATLVAYYPTTIPSRKTKYPPHLEVITHLAAIQGFAPAFNSYIYQDVQPGFAEHDLDEFDKVACGLAWTRTLAGLRKGFKVEANLEKIWEEHLACR